MNKIKVVNIKCGGCEKGIIDALEKAGLKNIGESRFKKHRSRCRKSRNRF
jgi:hypothetical protein